MSAIHKPKTLFSHIKAITSEQDPNYFDTLSESDIKVWNNFMIHRFLSMNTDWVDLIATIQPYTQILKPKQLYLVLIGLIPRGNHYNRYIKGKTETKYEPWLVKLIKQEYLCSLREATDYCEILYSTKEGRTHIKYICEKYGIEKKEIVKLRLKIK